MANSERQPTCSTCNRPWREDDVPPEPPVGTWVRDRYGALAMHHEGGGWAPKGFLPFGKWDAMWRARGPLLICDGPTAESARSEHG